MAGHVQVVAKELRKLALSKKIREKKELDVDEEEDKKTLLVGLFAFVPMERVAQNSQSEAVNKTIPVGVGVSVLSFFFS